MRSYFWIREKSRGNVYAISQTLGLSEHTLLLRNENVRSAPLASNCDYSWYPDKETILVEFKSSRTFVEEEAQFREEMGRYLCGNRLDCSLEMALENARNWVCTGYEVAITANARFLHKTLIHYHVKPIVTCKEDGDYSQDAPRLLLSNGIPLHECHCGCVLTYYQPFGWSYQARQKPKEPLYASAGYCWAGICVGVLSGNIAWHVDPTMCGYRFFDFACFSDGTCEGIPSYDSGEQARRLEGSRNGVLVYKDAGYKKPILIGGCVNCYGGLVYVNEAMPVCNLHFIAQPSAQNNDQLVIPYYSDICAAWGLEGNRARLFRAYSAGVFNSSSFGVRTPYPRSFLREVCGYSGFYKNTDLAQMKRWMDANITGSCYPYCQCFYHRLMCGAGEVVGIYGSPDSVYQGKPTGAIIKMEGVNGCYKYDPSCGYYGEWQETVYAKGTLYFYGANEWCACVGDFVVGCHSMDTVGYLGGYNKTAESNGYPPHHIVTLQSRDSFQAELKLDNFHAIAWDAIARVKYKLVTNENWEDFDSSELWNAFYGAMYTEMPIYITGNTYDGMPVQFTIEEHGITGTINLTGNAAVFTLKKLCEICGINPSYSTVGECYELLTSGLTIAILTNEWRTDTPPYAWVQKIGISPTFNEEPCTNWLC